MSLRFVLLLSVFLPLPVLASTLGFSWDNDLFVGADGQYTNGVRISWVGDAHDHCDSNGSVTCGLAGVLSPLPGISLDDEKHALTLSLEQVMITPGDISQSAPNYADLPYAGYSNLEMGLFSWNGDNLFGYGVRLGVVGPESGAEQSQKVVHKITGSTEPQGWDNQLGTDLIGGAYFINARRFHQFQWDSGFQGELGYAWGVDANNFHGTASAGGFLRVGRNLPRNFIPDYAGIGTAGSLVGLFDGSGFGWEAFVASFGEYIGYSYLEHHAEEYDVEARDGVLGLVVGGGVHWDRFSFTLTLQSSTSPLRSSDDNFSFGNMSFMWQI
ncbi:lipid A deacylase LpxR family protein [Alcanivorax sp.]|uniref:lipid A deacylase LpxR family protein n=1 Tax=Alcanivorax sp. TaxID=1872427 RepID=UPI002B264C9E|nr:lipid A deacylase LpxR family protein [Alcanivorax sp.]